MLDKLLIILLNIKEKTILKRIEYLIFNCTYNQNELRRHLEPLEEQGRSLVKLRNLIKYN